MKFLVLVFILLLSSGCKRIFPDAISGATTTVLKNGNSLYHTTDPVIMKTGTLEIMGEVNNPGKVNFRKLYKREVFIKEADLTSEQNVNFIGAYRYRGYSLFDILQPFAADKKNAETFRPAIDLYILIENAAGETVAFSWSEIFHTINPHQVLIATEAAPVVPYKKEVEYPVAEHWKIVAASDLYAFRMLDNPVAIRVYSFDKKEYEITKNMNPMFSESITVIMNDELIGNLEENDSDSKSYPAVFYGMGMGYHKTEGFTGPLLNNLMQDFIQKTSREWNRNGLVCFAGADGYRTVFSYSELFNRTDGVSAILAVTRDNGGYYRMFHPLDFYADRSVKSLKEIYFFNP
jgi:hypothetical protein